MGAKTQLEGVVVSDRMQNSVVVAVDRQERHPLYGKVQRRRSKFMAHNAGNEAKAGDRVQITESRPLSRRKRWIVTRILVRAESV